MTEDRRQFIRLPMDATATLHCREGNWPARLVDISLRGALIGRPEGCPELTPGTPGRLHILLGESDPVIDMQGRIAHVHPGYLGFHCEQIDLESAGHLRRLLELNLGADKVERELGELLALMERG